MKKLAIFCLFVIVGLCATSFKPGGEEEMTWYNWNDGYPLATQNQKLIFVDVYTNWCGWCKKMDRDVFADNDIQKFLDKNFVNIKLNPERTDQTYQIDTVKLNGYQLFSLLTNGQRTGFPTVVVLNPKGNKIIHAQSGYQDADDFKQTMKK